MGDYTFLLMLIAAFGLLMLMNSFTRKKQRQQQAERRAAVQLGARVRTHSGFYGTVVDMDGDAVTLESPGGAETVWHKNAIHGAEEPPFAVAEELAAADESALVAADEAALTAPPADEATPEAASDVVEDRRTDDEPGPGRA